MREAYPVVRLKMLITAIVCGSLVTLATGLFVNTPPMQVGAVHYGYPLGWLTRLIVSPEYLPWRVRPAELVLDIVVWSTISAIVLFIMERK